MKKLLLAATTLIALSVGAAQAVPVTGTIGLTDVGAPSSPSAFIGAGSTISLDTALFQANGTGDFVAVNGGTLLGRFLATTLPFTLSNGSSFGFTNAAWGDFSGTLTIIGSSLSASSRSIIAYALGTFTPHFGGFTAGPASVTFSVTQTGTSANAAISFSGTLAAPPAPIPAPPAAMLLGAGLLGLGLVRRRAA